VHLPSRYNGAIFTDDGGNNLLAIVKFLDPFAAFFALVDIYPVKTDARFTLRNK
jgi:hypothetical protein